MQILIISVIDYMKNKRELIDNGIYHITHRINGKQHYLDNGIFKAIFLDVLKRCRDKFEFLLFKYPPLIFK